MITQTRPHAQQPPSQPPTPAYRDARARFVLSTASDVKNFLVHLGLQALANGDMARVHEITDLLRRRGLKHA
jgi:hypothetical protein